MNRNRDMAKGNIALILAAIIWGSGFVAQKLGMAYIGPFTFNAARQLLACCLLLPYAYFVAKRSKIFSREFNKAAVVTARKKDLLIASVVCGVFLALGTNAQQIGLVTVSAGKSGFISAIYIVLVPVIGLLFGRRIAGRIWLCVGLAIMGFAFLSLKQGFGEVSVGDWLTLLSAGFFACQIVAVNHFVTRNNAILISGCQMLLSGVISLAGALIFENPVWAEILESAMPILYSALMPTALGYTLQILGQKYTDPTVAALIMSLEAVFAVVLGAIFLHEHMILREVIGCVCILIATLVAQMPDRGPHDPPRQSGRAR